MVFVVSAKSGSSRMNINEWSFVDIFLLRALLRGSRDMVLKVVTIQDVG